MRRNNLGDHDRAAGRCTWTTMCRALKTFVFFGGAGGFSSTHGEFNPRAAPVWLIEPEDEGRQPCISATSYRSLLRDPRRW
jgi:hypothetical protein